MNDTPLVSVPSNRQETRFADPERTLIRPRSRFSACIAPAGGLVGGGVVGDGGGVVGEGGVVGDGGGVVGVVAPVQVVPFSAKLVGTGLLPVHEPLKPKLALALVPMVALWSTLRAVTWVPDWVTVAFQAWVTCCPAA
ncbi:hypothetical protein Jiend_46740 [Micromonospora endophytica]|nr:hypothetical protein Jiend_46740 [Micromonospora endophytica]